jgi:CBS domain containing-hemolysin-like protein
VNLLLAALLLAGNAFFVGAQFALITTRRDQIEPLAASGHRAPRLTLGLTRQLSRMLAGSQLGIAICSVGLGAVAEPSFAHLLERVFNALRLPAGLLHPTAFVIALGVVSYAHMVFGEMVPKNLALAGPLRAALLLGPPMAAWVQATRPLLVAVNAAANGVLRLFRVEPKSELASSYTPDELADLIAESVAEGLLDTTDQRRLTRALRLDQHTAGDLAIPMAELVTVEASGTPQALEELVGRTGYSRFPVRATGPDGEPDLVGYVHAKDLLDLDPAERTAPIPTRLVRPMVTLDADTPLTRAFTSLQAAGGHLGRVVEAGATRGTIALEDLLEELVGEIQDATHRQRPPEHRPP